MDPQEPKIPEQQGVGTAPPAPEPNITMPPAPAGPSEVFQTENPLYQAPVESQAQISQTRPVYTQEVPPVPPVQEPPKETGMLGVKDESTVPFSPGGMHRNGGRKFPIRKILAGLGTVIFLLGIAFAANTIFFSKKAPIGPKEPVTITYWGLWEDPQALGGQILEFESKNKNIKIKYIKQSKEDYRERLVNSLAKGQGPDIFRFHNTWVPMLASSLSVLPPSVIDAGTFQKTFYPVAAKDLRRGADIVGIPLMFDGLGLYINDEIFSANGKNPPATWDELRKLAIELTVRDGEGRIQQAGVAMGRTDNLDHWEDILALMMLQNGADLGNPVGKLAEDPLAFFTVFSTKDRVWDETLPPSTQAFAAGKLAMYFGPSWRAFEMKSQNPNLSFRVVPVPQLPKASPTEPDITWASYWAEGVWVKSKYQKEAWEFLKFLSSKDSLQKLYQAAAASRLFGPPYPIPEMAALLKEDPVVGAYVKQAPQARSWYLTSRTFDGQTGINSRISAYFADAVNGVVNEGKEAGEVLGTAAQGVKQVLSSYSSQ